MMSVSESITPALPNRAILGTEAPRRRQQTAGMLARRPDLSDEAILAAIAERLVFEGRDASHAPGVLKAALAGNSIAKCMVRKLVLPAPQSSLLMPTQVILRERKERERSGSWLRRVSFGR